MRDLEAFTALEAGLLAARGACRERRAHRARGALQAPQAPRLLRKIYRLYAGLIAPKYLNALLGLYSSTGSTRALALQLLYRLYTVVQLRKLRSSTSS